MVMYHYVRDHSPMKCMSTAAFEKQLRWIGDHYDVVSLSGICSKTNEKTTCVLTFDDGLKDSIRTILPILKKVGQTGIFFIPGAILAEKRILSVHKRHMLMAQIGSARLVEALNKRLPAELEIYEDPACQGEFLDDPLTNSMKWMLDYLDAEIIDPIIDDIFRRFIGDEAAHFKELYLSANDIKELIDAGMEIGVHGYSHLQLGVLPYRAQEAEITKATAVVKPLIGNSPLYMSYPSGSYSPLTIRLLKKHGYAGAVTIEKHANTQDVSSFQWGRYDCIDLPR